VHVPFCAASCPYCDYPHAAERSSEAHEAFVAALRAEVQRRTRFHAAPVRTIYLGGGTPSQLSAAQLEQVLEALHGAFDTESVREVTLEALPDDLTPRWLAAVRALGATRLSVGVQSFFEEDLRVLGRRHDAGEAERAVPLAREAGFQNVSVDLLFGLPGQSLSRWQATLEKATQQAPSHVTLYRLTAEAGTPLGERVAGGATPLPDADRTAAQYERALDVLDAAGLPLYEQTHLARPGRTSAHTRRYWRHETVLGFGPGARSFFQRPDGRAARRANAPDWEAYVQSRACPDDAVPHTQEPLAPGALADEYVALRLRTAAGLSLRRLADRYGRDLRAQRGPTLDRLCAEGYLERCGDRLRPTRAGRLRLDAITDALLWGLGSSKNEPAV
jgi:oxygen-independent coproporphyrinogen-3 oxidase